MTSAPPPLVLNRRLGVATPAECSNAPLRLVLSAEERTRLRGHRRSSCGQDLLLQLPRGPALEPGEWLAQEDGVLEPLLRHRGLEVGRAEEAFRPESGAYGNVPHSHGHP
ncbi:MAG: hypothetical protein ACOVQK_06570 [Cyanobium sp.]